MKNIIVELSFQVGVGTYKVKFHNNQQGCPQVGLSRVCAQLETDPIKSGGEIPNLALTTNSHKLSQIGLRCMAVSFDFNRNINIKH